MPAIADQSAGCDRLRLFRVVRYLPGDWRAAMFGDDLRAGVAQASREETAEYTPVGVQGARAMGIVVGLRRSLGDPADVHRSIIGIERKREIEPVRGWRCADFYISGKTLNDDHGVAAVPADEGGTCGRKVGTDVCVANRGDWYWHPRQECARCGQAGLAAAVGQQAVMPNAVEAAGQHMQQEAAHEFLRRQRHDLVARSALGAVVLPTERHATLVQCKQSAERNMC